MKEPDCWFCCQCMRGPWTYLLDQACHFCQHKACGTCTPYYSETRKSELRPSSGYHGKQDARSSTPGSQSKPNLETHAQISDSGQAPMPKHSAPKDTSGSDEFDLFLEFNNSERTEASKMTANQDDSVRSFKSDGIGVPRASTSQWITKFENELGTVLATSHEMNLVYEVALRLMPRQMLAIELADKLRALASNTNHYEGIPLARHFRVLFGSEIRCKRIAREIVARYLGKTYGVSEQVSEWFHEADKTDYPPPEPSQTGVNLVSELKELDRKRRPAFLNVGSSRASNEPEGDLEYIDQEAERASASQLNTTVSMLVESIPFLHMVLDLKESLLPQGLLSELSTILPENIRFCSDQGGSFTGAFQGMIERVTGLSWDWAPIARQMRPLNRDEVRVSWSCLCGEARWQELSVVQAYFLEEILQSGREKPVRRPLCIAREATPRDAGPANSRPSTSQRNISPELNELRAKLDASTSGASSGMNTPTDGRGRLGLHTDNCSNPYSKTVAPSSTEPAKLRWLLFGTTRGRKTLEIGQIEDLHLKSDCLFLQKLRQEHRRLRGPLRSYLSYWRLDHWKFVRFRRYQSIRDRIIVDKIDLPPPEAKDYEFHPRPPAISIRDPGITPHEFRMLMQSCTKSCSASSYNLLHDCVAMEDHVDRYVTRLPKKVTQSGIDVYDQVNDVAWGIEACFVVSALYVFVLHIVFFVGPFGFWIWWQKRHPDDLQNATVPASIFIGSVSLFWCSTGILKMFREGF